MWRVAQFDTLRLRLVKIAARVIQGNRLKIRVTNGRRAESVVIL